MGGDENRAVGFATKMTPIIEMVEANASKGPKGSFKTILPRMAVKTGPKKKMVVASARGKTLNAKKKNPSAQVPANPRQNNRKRTFLFPQGEMFK